MFAQTTSPLGSNLESIEPYDYQTDLIGGYKIVFKVDKDTEYLYLARKGKTIAELSSMSKGLPYKNLGYVGADFKEYFVLVHSFGSGNPHQIELIKKSTGKNLLSRDACWIDVVEKKEVLLYSDEGEPSAKDKMILYNIRTGRKQYFHFPRDIFDGPEVLYRIKIKQLTDKFLIIEYEANKYHKTKKYII